MTTEDQCLELNRIAGDITWRLKTGTPEERASLLLFIEYHCGFSERARLEAWIEDGMPDA